MREKSSKFFSSETHHDSHGVLVMVKSHHSCFSQVRYQIKVGTLVYDYINMLSKKRGEIGQNQHLKIRHISVNLNYFTQ